MQLAAAYQYYGYSTLLPKPVELGQSTIVIQYEVRTPISHKCGGAYLKVDGVGWGGG